VIAKACGSDEVQDVGNAQVQGYAGRQRSNRGTQVLVGNKPQAQHLKGRPGKETDQCRWNRPASLFRQDHECTGHESESQSPPVDRHRAVQRSQQFFRPIDIQGAG